MSGELASERWTPVQRVETVLLSIISLLDDAEINSPANVDAAVLLRDNFADYKLRVAKDVEESRLNIPAGFTVPTDEILKKDAEAKAMRAKLDDDTDFWAESDEDFDFGSDTASEVGGDDAGTGEDDEEEDEKDSNEGDAMEEE